MGADLIAGPGKLAGTGFQSRVAASAARRARSSASPPSSTYFVTIVVLLFAWIVVVLSFFILAVQLFITILEFKLTTLAGFVLVPFAFWGNTAFLAERVLGNVVSSGIKVLVLAVIVGIGTIVLSAKFTHLRFQGQQTEPGMDAMSLALASLSLFGLGIFGPGIATGLVSGAPQLGAGAALGTAAAPGRRHACWPVPVRRCLGRRAASPPSVPAAAVGSGASTAYRLGQATSGEAGLAGVGAGLAGVAHAAGGAARQGMGSLASAGSTSDGRAGARAAWRATGGTMATGAGNPDFALGDSAPAWARQLHRAQRRRGHVQMATQAIKDGDRPGHGIQCQHS